MNASQTMNASQMLHQMCHEVLSNADVKAIRKSRGFSAQEAASRALLENFFPSDIGVAAAMGTLTEEEVTLLHLLKLTGETVDIAFFARIYGDSTTTQYYYPTFTQRYKNVLKQVRTALVRKGLLLMAEDQMAWSAETKMERWRFRLPREFERFLPPLIRSARTLAGNGDLRADVVRDKLKELAGDRGLASSTDRQHELRIVDGQLRMGEREFRARHLVEWQQASWEAAVPAPKIKDAPLGHKGIKVSPREAVTYAFDQLGEHEWLHPAPLDLPLRVFCDAPLSGADVCEAGWQWGYLAKQVVDRSPYYRRPAQEAAAPADVDPATYLVVTDERLTVDLDTVPYASLEQLAHMSSARVIGGQLVMTPNLVRTGRVIESVRDRPLTQWLREHAPAYRQALETAASRWGRQIVHENLLIARVNDLGLKVQLERAFSKDVVFLPNGYLALPGELLPAVEKVIAKSGHVIKTVQRNG